MIIATLLNLLNIAFDFFRLSIEMLHSEIKDFRAITTTNGKLAIVYRSFLLSYHQNGTAAASAAEAAGLQGYWKEYADKLFEEQSEWEYADTSERTELFNKYFKEVTNNKGDLDKFNQDIASEAVSKKISFDMGIGKRVDVILLINGVVLCLEFKAGAERFETADKEQVWDYALDLKNFHEPSRDLFVAPVLVATDAPDEPFELATCNYDDKVSLALCL